MYYIKIKNLKTQEEFTKNFKTLEEAILYKKYNSIFNGWDKKEVWKAEPFVTEEDLNIVVEIADRELLNSKNEKVIQKFYKLQPQFRFMEDNFTLDDVESYWSNYRRIRNELLMSTDWTQIADSSLDKDQRFEYRKYREYLRGCPKLHNDLTIKNSVPKTFEEWKQGLR